MAFQPTLFFFFRFIALHSFDCIPWHWWCVCTLVTMCSPNETIFLVFFLYSGELAPCCENINTIVSAKGSESKTFRVNNDLEIMKIYNIFNISNIFRIMKMLERTLLSMERHPFIAQGLAHSYPPPSWVLIRSSMPRTQSDCISHPRSRDEEERTSRVWM